MTHSPTPTELLALRTANAALLASPDSFCDMVATVVFALGSAQLLQSPETAAELSRLRAQVAERPPVLESEQAALLAEMIGDVRPARVGLLLSLGESVRDQRTHEHTSQREDWYCTNLAAYSGERMGPVLRRLLNTEAEAVRLRARVAELEAERSRPAPVLASPVDSRERDEYRFCGGDLGRSEFPFTCNRRVAHKGPCGGQLDPDPVEDQYVSPLHQNHKVPHDLPEVPHA